MTKIVTDAHQFYLTAPSPCPYLPGRQERKVFTHLVGPHSTELHDLLTQGGFRRSQGIAYRPACEFCMACVSVRVCVDAFRPTPSMRRVWKANSRPDRPLPPGPGDERPVQPLPPLSRQPPFRRRHGAHVGARLRADGGGQPRRQRRRRISPARPGQPISGRDEGEIVACALTDILSDGLSMVYSFFDPDQAERSLGTFMILEHIERARKLGKPYVYLGYWVDGSPKMDYKARFRPQERLSPRGWARIG